MILLLDNYDSFTHNLARYFRELGFEVNVVRNDQITIAEIESLSPAALVISPGPCTPDEAGISLQAIEYFAGKLPILGVCLGHQAIGQVFGGNVVRAQRVMHGKTSNIRHSDTGLFKDLAQPLRVVRYHSLVLSETDLPGDLVVDAWVDDNDQAREIMAIRHKSLPVFGVQFHPESVLSKSGHQLLDNFSQFISPSPLRIKSPQEKLPA